MREGKMCRSTKNAVVLWTFAGLASCAFGEVEFQLVQGGTQTVTELTVNPGDPFTLDLLAQSIVAEAGVNAELDSFAYRIEFSSEEFTLTSNSFGAPFENDVPSMGGFNGSVPWAPPAIDITNGADSGSPLSTPTIADLYRTTASEAGVPGFRPNLIVETLGLLAPVSLGDYLIGLNVAEAADTFGSSHTASNGTDFVLHVVPEPGTAVVMLCSVFCYTVGRRRLRK